MLMGVSHHCIVACAHLLKSTDRSTATKAAPLLLTNGPVRYEAVLNSSGTSRWGEVMVPTCNSMHSWLLYTYSAASLGYQAASTMTCYPTQSHYPDIERTSHFPILIMLSAKLGSDKCQF